MKRYVLFRRFMENAICGKVDMPPFTKCYEKDNVIYYEEHPICVVTSENAHQYFAWDDDNNGILRGKLTNAIQDTLRRKDNHYQDRWDEIWDNELCQKYKRKEHADHWLWNHDFFSAPINELQYIANLIGARVNED